MAHQTSAKAVEPTLAVRPQEIAELRWSKKNRRPYKNDLARLIGHKILSWLLVAVHEVPAEERSCARLRRVTLRDNRTEGGNLSGRIEYTLSKGKKVHKAIFVVNPFSDTGLSGKVFATDVEML